MNFSNILNIKKLKGFTVFIILIAGCNCSLFSQTKFGVFVEPALNWMSPESRTVNSEGLKFGFSGGLTMDNYFQENYAFATGISTGIQSGSLKFDEPRLMSVYDEVDTLPAGTIVDYKLNYITVPVGLKLKSNQIGYSTFFVNIGFTNQINIKAVASSDNIDGLDDDSIKDEINLFNIGYHFGGGVEYAIGEDTALSLGVLYHNGFTDITDSSPRVVSRVVSFRVGVIF